MDLKWLEDFVSLGNTGNFRQSSQERHISQPAFSRRIKALESWIGVELIDRSTFPAKLTDAGVAFRPIAESIIDLAYQSRNSFRNGSPAKDRPITFACMDILAGNYMPHLLNRMEPKTGQINARVLTAFPSAESYLTSLEDGTSDFLVCYKDDGDAIRIDPTKFPSIALNVEKIVPVAAPSALGRAAIPPNGTAERPVPFLPYTPHTYLGRIILDHIKRNHQDVVFRQVFESTIASSIKEMVLLGYGLGWLPQSSIAANLADGSLVRAAPATFDIKISVRIFRYAEERHRLVETFWSILQGQQMSDTSIPYVGPRLVSG